MLTEVNLLGKIVSGYGLMAVCGAVAVLLGGWLAVRHFHLEESSFFILFGYAVLGAAVGSKLLFLIVSADVIEWNRLGELQYWFILLTTGFVFYGGLIGALGMMLLAGRIHHFSTLSYLRKIAFCIPLGHGFGRIGCFFAGCCYGIPYDGPLAVVFPAGSEAPAGVPLFPVQLLEALCLFILAGVLLVLVLRGCETGLIIYMISYGVIRFLTEFLRYDGIRGALGPFSTSQWISLPVILLGVILVVLRRRKAEGDAAAADGDTAGECQ